MRNLCLILLIPVCTLAAQGTALQTSPNTGWPPEESLLQETRATMQRAVEWLASKQQPEGHWSNPTFPALTALPLWAMLDTGWRDEEHLRKAVQYILDSRHENGAIYRVPTEERKGGGLANYNTALSIVALHKTGDPDLTETILKGRRHLAGNQHLGADVYRGGMAYDPETGRAYTDLSNSYIAYEAMRITEEIEDFRTAGEAKADMNWKEAEKFVTRVHNDPRFNDLPWVSDAQDDKGGFAYHPDNTRAGTFTNAEGKVMFRSFGSMTYAGMLAYIYADVDKEDPRVLSTFDWAMRHFTVTENPGTGKEGLYYYLNVMAKGLNTYGQDTIYPKDGGTPFSWRTKLIEQLLSTYKTDDQGRVYWVNENSRYWESDPVLVTSYALIALQYALQ